MVAVLAAVRVLVLVPEVVLVVETVLVVQGREAQEKVALALAEGKAQSPSDYKSLVL